MIKCMAGSRKNMLYENRGLEKETRRKGRRRGVNNVYV